MKSSQKSRHIESTHPLDNPMCYHRNTLDTFNIICFQSIVTFVHLVCTIKVIEVYLNAENEDEENTILRISFSFFNIEQVTVAILQSFRIPEKFLL